MHIRLTTLAAASGHPAFLKLFVFHEVPLAVILIEQSLVAAGF
jgi:hypothetical protein